MPQFIKNLLFPGFILLFVLLGSGMKTSHAAWVFDKASGSSLTFKDDRSGRTETLKTDVAGATFIAILTDPESGTSYTLFEGKACPKCDVANRSLFLQRIDGKGKATAFVFPGRITDPKKNALVYEGRVFYGHCLPSVKAGVVAHQRELVDRRGTQRSVLIAEPGPQYVYEVLLERKLPSVNTTLDLVKRKSCFEISGRSRSVLKKPLDLTPKKGLDDDEEEDAEVAEKAGPDESPNTD